MYPGNMVCPEMTEKLLTGMVSHYFAGLSMKSEFPEPFSTTSINIRESIIIKEKAFLSFFFFFFFFFLLDANHPLGLMH